MLLRWIPSPFEKASRSFALTISWIEMSFELILLKTRGPSVSTGAVAKAGLALDPDSATVPMAAAATMNNKRAPAPIFLAHPCLVLLLLLLLLLLDVAGSSSANSPISRKEGFSLLLSFLSLELVILICCCCSAGVSIILCCCNTLRAVDPISCFALCKLLANPVRTL